MADQRCADLVRFYSLLDRLEATIGGARTLAACSGRMDWPRRGVYFFREMGESRSDTGSGGPRIVRVGTHALRESSPRTLWDRLGDHKGYAGAGGGNHRGSIFRLIVGTALLARDGQICPSWGDKNASRSAVKADEFTFECAVSRYIGAMPFVWLAIDDEPGPQSRRTYIEEHSIALLSNHGKRPLDAPSPAWLGRQCDRPLVRSSGLWNSDHVDAEYDPAFLDEFENLVAAAGGRR
jgi:hypothetical protein